MCRHPILNDIPTIATSCLIYDYEELKKHAGDSTYPIPAADDYANLHELKSRQAVVKKLSDGNSVFSHMLVLPNDVIRIFGEEAAEFRDELEGLQRDVHLLFVSC